MIKLNDEFFEQRAYPDGTPLTVNKVPYDLSL